MNVLLINPGWGRRISQKGRRFNRPWPPLSLMISASLLEQAGMRVKIVDGRVERDWQEKIERLVPESGWIGLTSSPLDRWQCPNLEIGSFLDLACSLPSEKLLIMGAHGSLFPKELLKRTRARAIIIGEPELKLLALLTSEEWTGISGIAFSNGGDLFLTGKPEPTGLGKLPVPAFHLIDPSKYAYELLGRPFTLFETSRGCPYTCTFCFKAMYGEGIRYKHVEQVMAEIEHGVCKFGFRYGYFIDLEFTMNRDRVMAICDELIARRYPLVWCCQTRADAVDRPLLKRMRQAGCRLIHFGVESASSRVLEDTKKRLTRDAIQEGIRLTQEAGIETACFFMLGFPGETPPEMGKTLSFAKKLNPTYASFHAVTPYPGTELGVADRSRSDIENQDIAFPSYCMGHSSIFLDRMIRKAYLSYYLRFPYVLSRLRHGPPRSWLAQFRLFTRFSA